MNVPDRTSRNPKMNAFFAGINGIAVGFNIASLVFVQDRETWPMWVGIVLCGALMIGAIFDRQTTVNRS